MLVVRYKFVQRDSPSISAGAVVVERWGVLTGVERDLGFAGWCCSYFLIQPVVI